MLEPQKFYVEKMTNADLYRPQDSIPRALSFITSISGNGFLLRADWVFTLMTGKDGEIFQ